VPLADDSGYQQIHVAVIAHAAVVDVVLEAGRSNSSPVKS